VGWRHGVFACLNLFKANPPTYYNTIFLSRYQRGIVPAASACETGYGDLPEAFFAQEWKND